MSHPDEPMPAPPVPTAPHDAEPDASASTLAPPGASVTMAGAPLDAAAVEPAVPSGAPYRVPAPPPSPEPPAPELYFGPPPRKPRPLMGPALSIFAVLLWSFVIAGQFASSWSLGIQVRSDPAFAIVVLTTLVAWIANMRRSAVAVPPRSKLHLFWRSVGAGVVAFVFFLLCLVAAAAVNSAMNADFVVAAVLVLVSLLAAIAGPHLTSTTAPQRTPRQRTALVVLWIAGTLLTLVAGADLAANG